jgi:raffinose/stachyose/melibiose transport system permease protein
MLTGKSTDKRLPRLYILLFGYINGTSEGLAIMKKHSSSLNLFYLPAVIMMMVFVIYPLSDAFRISFTQWNGYSQYYIYIGIENYKRMFGDKNLHLALKNTLIYGFGSTLFQNIFGLSSALYLNLHFKGHTIVRTFIYLPVMISGLIMGYIIYFFVQYNGGVFNEIRSWFDLKPVDFMAHGGRGVVIILIINVWQYIGISMVIYLAGLQNIPKMYYEAAIIDGTSSIGRFTYITLPLIIPAMSTAVTMNLIGGLKLFDVIQSLTAGGPGFATHSLSNYISNQYFKAQNAGYSAAVGIITFFLIMFIGFVFTHYFRTREVEI